MGREFHVRFREGLGVQFPRATRLIFSPDGKRLFAAVDNHSPAWSLGIFATALAVSPDGRSAATGHEDGTILLWDLRPAWKQLAVGPAAALTAEQADTCWADLLVEDPRKAYAALDRLAAAPAQAFPLFRKHLHPVNLSDRWLADRLAALDSDDFTAREKASRDLEAVLDVIRPRLQREMEPPLAGSPFALAPPPGRAVSLPLS